jgi:hypothetical protein
MRTVFLNHYPMLEALHNLCRGHEGDSVDVALSEHSLKAVKQDRQCAEGSRRAASQALRAQSVVHRAKQMRELTERGLVSRESGSGQLRVQEIDLEVPESLRQVIEIQIERLSKERASKEASVSGTLFSTVVSAPAANMDVLYRRQSPGRRAKLHVRVGEQLEALYAQRLSEAAPELAHHFEQSGDCLRPIKDLQLAADSAGRRFEPRQAAEILEHAIELVKKLPDAERAEF